MRGRKSYGRRYGRGVRRVRRRIQFSRRKRVYRKKRMVRRRRTRRSGRGLGSFRKRIMDATSALNTYGANSSARLTSGVGLQEYGVLTPMANPTDLQTIVGLLPTGAQKYFLDNCSQDLYMKNQSNNEQYVTVYKYMARRDVPAAEGSISQIYQQGWTDAGASGAGNYVGMTPFQNNKFCSMFKIIGVRKRKLHPGDTWNMRMKNKSMYYNIERMAYDKILAVGGYTKGYMVVSFGAPINDDTDRTVVAPGEGVVDVALVNRYQYREMADPVNTINLAQRFGNVGTESIMVWAKGQQDLQNDA